MSVRSKPIGAPGDLVRGIQFTGTHARQTGSGRTNRGGVIESVSPGSPAARAALLPGDIVLSLNGHRLRDVVDYQYYSDSAVIDLEVVRHKPSEKIETITIVRDAGESPGITFTQPTFAPIRECNNHCPFCFIDQLPGEMRSSLYIRDDDYRYSFLFGNFVTLTNLNASDWRRLEEQRLSPLYVSVHATDPSLRRLLLGNEKAPDIREQLRRLFDIGIQVHTQVVLCPGMNDGDALEQTVSELAAGYPSVLSIGLVPVGLTRTPAEILSDADVSCSRILPSAADLPLRQFEPAEARRVVERVQAWQRTNREMHGLSLVYVSDELYLLAGRNVPGAHSYDGYPQYENGIGMVRDLLDDWHATRRRRLGVTSGRPSTSMSVVCGEMIAPILAPILQEWSGLVGVEAELVPLRNSFFGPRVRVSGLLTARDILANRDRYRGDVVILPEVMLDKTGTRLLDNVTPSQLERDLGKPVLFAGLMSAVDKLTRNLAAAA